MQKKIENIEIQVLEFKDPFAGIGEEAGEGVQEGEVGSGASVGDLGDILKDEVQIQLGDISRYFQINRSSLSHNL